jgi:integrase
MPKRKPRGRHNLYLRGGTWWTRILDERESTGFPKSDLDNAKRVRDERLEAHRLRLAGIKREEPLPRLTLTALMDAYIAAESQPYDREKGGDQAGTKRTAHVDRFSRDRVLRHLDGKMLADDVTKEEIATLADKMAREKTSPSAQTRRKHLSFLRSVFSWAEQYPKVSGIRRSPFHELTKTQRKDFFPKSKTRAYVFSPEQLRGLYALAKWRLPLVRCAVHTAMRYAELTTLRWACVDLARRVLTVEARYAKNGTEREVGLGDVPFGILESLKPENVNLDGLVFTKPDGSRIDSLRTWWIAAVLKVWKPSKPSERRPRFHDLRKTCATRVESVSSHAVAKLLLGHADEDVTDSYIKPEIGDVIAALNRAARLIDGEQVGNVVQFSATSANGTTNGTISSEAV